VGVGLIVAEVKHLLLPLRLTVTVIGLLRRLAFSICISTYTPEQELLFMERNADGC
jgi:hypothetical protein